MRKAEKRRRGEERAKKQAEESRLSGLEAIRRDHEAHERRRREVQAMADEMNKSHAKILADHGA